MKKTTVSLLALSSLAACTAQVGLHEAIDLPKDSAATCERQCDSIGLEFDGVAIVGTSVACLCEPRDAPAASQSRRRAGAAHAVAIEDADDPEPTFP